MATGDGGEWHAAERRSGDEELLKKTADALIHTSRSARDPNVRDSAEVFEVIFEITLSGMGGKIADI